MRIASARTGLAWIRRGQTTAVSRRYNGVRLTDPDNGRCHLGRSDEYALQWAARAPVMKVTDGAHVNPA